MSAVYPHMLCTEPDTTDHQAAAEVAYVKEILRVTEKVSFHIGTCIGSPPPLQPIGPGSRMPEKNISVIFQNPDPPRIST